MAGASRGEKVKKVLRIFLIAVGVIVAVLLLALPVTSQPSFCGSCHEIKSAYDRWKASTHQRVKCVECHVRPGFVNYVKAKFEAAYYIYAHVTDIYPHPVVLKREIANEVCLRCHSANRVISAGGDLIVPHQHHVERLQIPCSRCHSNLHSAVVGSDESAEVKGVVFYHKLCWECHNGVQATNKCSACHTKKAVPKDHLAGDFGKTHGELSKTQDCAKCHGYTKDFCIDCHKKKPSSHTQAANWKSEHGAVAKERLAGCMACHTPTEDDSFCWRCHDRE